jgi:hypothetical protein
MVSFLGTVDINWLPAAVASAAYDPKRRFAVVN